MNVHVNLQLILLLAFITNCLQFTLYGQLSGRYNPDKKHEMMGGMVGIDQTLATLLRNISTSELESCFLTILYDRIYETTVTLSSLVTLPNFKQLYQIENLNDINGILWKDKACKAYIFLLDDHSKLFDLAAHSKAWNYQGKYIIATKGKEQFISFLKSDKGKNSEFVAGIVLSRNKSKWVIYTREFFPKLQLLPFPNFDTSKKIFNEKFKNFKGATIKVCNFEMEPSVIFYREKGKPIYRYGRDIELVKALAETLHFQIEFVEPPNNEFWGVLLENGSYTGMIGKVIRGEVDIGAANAYIGRLDEIMDYSTTYDYTPACFLAPIPQPLPQWQSILRPFNLDSWIFILVIAATSFALLCVVAYRSSRRNRHNLKPGLECLLLTIRLHCRESTNIRANVGNHKVFLLFLSIYCLIVTIAYSSNLTAFLTVPQQPKSIETISELVDSKMAVNEVIPYYSCYMAESSDTLLRKLSKQMVTYDDFKRAMAVVSKGTAFYIENKPYIEYLYALNFTSGGASQFRIMKECLSSFQIVLYLGKHTPIRKTINDVINRIIEAGLVKKWLIDAIIQAKQFKRASQDNFSQKVISVDVDVEYKNKNLSLNHLQGIFWILIVGQLVAITVFAIEKSGRWVNKQNAKKI